MRLPEKLSQTLDTMRLLLIRHASHDLLGKALAGRTSVPLNDVGICEAKQLARKLVDEGITTLISSPTLRAVQTAMPLAESLGLEIVSSRAFDEVDFGDWTGRSFAELDLLPEWQQWNKDRDHGEAPGGETMRSAQKRVVQGIWHLKQQYQGQTVAVFSHCDVIKAALLHFLGAPLQSIFRLEIAPCSVGIVVFHGDDPLVTKID